jgi:predicted small secreted protein
MVDSPLDRGQEAVDVRIRHTGGSLNPAMERNHMFGTKTEKLDESPLLSRTARAALLATIAVTALALQACNTTEGAGKDIKAVGESIEDAAD